MGRVCERCGFLQVKVMRPEVRSGAAVCFPLQLLVDGGCASSRPQVPGAAHLLGPARCVRCRAVAPSAISWVICWAALNFSLNFSLPGHRILGPAVAKGSGAALLCSGGAAVSTAGKEPGAS